MHADKIHEYRGLIRRLIGEMTALLQRQKNLQAEPCCVFDDEHGHYLLLSLGWKDHERIRGTTLHVRLRDNKFWIEHDMTEDGITPQLLEAGVPKSDIVLAFHPPWKRPLTGFAVT